MHFSRVRRRGEDLQRAFSFSEPLAVAYYSSTHDSIHVIPLKNAHHYFYLTLLFSVEVANIVVVQLFFS